jgi:hypothetical protein
MVTKTTINLAGPQGNSISLLASANKLGIQIGMKRAKIQAIQDDMVSGDYDNLVGIFKDNFGQVAQIIDPDDKGLWTELTVAAQQREAAKNKEDDDDKDDNKKEVEV